MSQIVIRELYDADDILALVNKINYNFDQLVAAGGGPQGPIGESGPTGPAGVRGIRGSEWFAATGATGIINVPTDGELRENDFRLAVNGDVEYYDMNIWNFSGINISGPTGQKGDTGDGTISVIHSDVSTGGQIIPNISDGSKLRLSDHIANIDSNNDEDDFDSGVGYIDKGLDFTTLGYGNNSLVLGRYESIFRINGTGDPRFDAWPTEEADVPMFIVAANDYKNPEPGTTYDELGDFNNGIAIGLNMTHDAYDTLYTNVDEFANYAAFTQLKTLNRNFDFGIHSPGHIELQSRTNTFRLSSGFSRNSIKEITNIDQWANILKSDSYFESRIGDNFVIKLDASSRTDVNATSQLIHIADNVSIESKLSRVLTGSLLSDKNVTVFGKDVNMSAPSQNANEIIIVNDNTSFTESLTSKYNGKTSIEQQVYENRDSNSYTDTQLRIGQARVHLDESDSSDSSKNFFYMGQSFDTPIVGYSAANFRVPSGPKSFGPSASAWSFLPEESDDFEYLGYNILDGFAPSGLLDVDTDRSLTRLGIFPGFFNQKRDAAGNLDPSDPNGRANMESYIDDGHKLLPSGSLDLYGTVRIREYGLAENKEGYVAINAGHGIVKWEEENKVGIGTGAIIMISELAMSNFNFFTMTGRAYGSTSAGGNDNRQILSYWANTYAYGTIGSTATFNHWSAALPGKGADDWEGYYICNGAILADSRDIFARGFFSTEKGINAYASNKSAPDLIKNTEYGENFDKYDDEYHVRYQGEVPAYSNNSTDFATNYISQVTNNVEFYGGKGLSLLHPTENDSQFRVVLPNYFGRFPKQVFPSSESIALSNRDNDAPLINSARIPTLTYYKQDDEGIYQINQKWPLSSAFYDGGFPYIRNETLPIHEHYIGEYTSINGISGSYNSLVPSIGVGNDNPALTKEPTGNYRYTTGMPTNENPNNENGDRILGTYANNNSYYIGRDWSTANTSNYLPDLDIAGYRKRSQKFHDPVFKGTYFTIKLKGLRNPNRGDSLIPDFDFIAGVPFSGYNNNTGVYDANERDMSWYSNVTTVTGRQWKSGSEINISVNNLTTGIFISPKIGNIYIDEFEPIYRNENTSHPYQIINLPEDGMKANVEEIYTNVYTEPLI